MIRRIVALLVLAWALGFIGFAVTLPGPAGVQPTDAVVALTGGEGRIDRGLQAVRQHWARRMLVAGVDPEVREAEFAAQYHVPAPMMRCCVALGYESVDTKSNAQEAARWVADRHIGSVRLVTSDWHMRRAIADFRAALPPRFALVADAVPSRPSLNILFGEYNKLLARWLLRAWHG